MHDRSTRRRFLQGGLTASLIALAGCSGADIPNERPDTGGNSTDLSDESSPGPEQTTRRFLVAVANANQSRIDDLTYETASIQPERTYSITIDRIEKTPLAAAIESSRYEMTQSEIETLESELRSAVSAAGGDDFAVVEFSARFEDAGRDSGYIVLIEREGAWRIYGLGLKSIVRGPAPQTGDDEATTARVTNQVNVVATNGLVREGVVATVHIVIVPAPGSEEIDLSRATIQWIGPEGSRMLTYGAEGAADTFTVEAQSDPDGSLDERAVMNSDDRALISMNLSANDTSLDPGTGAEVSLTLPTGATTSITLQVPDSLDGREAVSL